MLNTLAAPPVELEIPFSTRAKASHRRVHPTATIGKNVSLGRDVRIGAFAVIDDDTKIGAKADIKAYVYVGPMVTIGAGSVLHPHVTVRDQVVIGRNVSIGCGSVIGSDGFGFAVNSGVNHKIPQVGTVEIEDDAWIGSNVTIDRATIGVTRIRRGARVDNLAQIAHNVEVGERSVLGPQVGVAGSSIIGSDCDIGEKTGINGHITIGDNVSVHPFSGLHRSIGNDEKVMGAPAYPVEREKTLQAILRELPSIVREFQRLKRKLSSQL